MPGFGYDGVDAEAGPAPHTALPAHQQQHQAHSAAAGANGRTSAAGASRLDTGAYSNPGFDLGWAGEGLSMRLDSMQSMPRTCCADLDRTRCMDVLASLATTAVLDSNTGGTVSQGDPTQTMPVPLTQLVPQGVVHAQGGEVLSQAVQASQHAAGSTDGASAWSMGKLPAISLCGITTHSSRMGAAR